MSFPAVRPFLGASCAFSLAALMVSRPAHATFSVLAADTQTGVVGAAGASCVSDFVSDGSDDFSLSEIAALEANVGGVIAQAAFFEDGRDRVFSEIQMGARADDALSVVLSPVFDPVDDTGGFHSRQYAAVTVDGGVGAFTGADNDVFAGHIPGTVDRFVFSVQGNFLTRDAVLNALVRGFEETPGALGPRLIGALARVVEEGGGDSRCSPHSADVAFLSLAIPGEPLFKTETVLPEEDATAHLVENIPRLLPTEPTPNSDDPSSDPQVESYSTADSCGCQTVGRDERPRFWFWVIAAGLLAWRRRSASAREL